MLHDGLVIATIVSPFHKLNEYYRLKSQTKVFPSVHIISLYKLNVIVVLRCAFSFVSCSLLFKEEDFLVGIILSIVD